MIPKASRGLGFKVKNLNFKYDGATHKIFEGLDLEIQPGEAFGIIGESGSGKSTLISLLLGQLEPQSGEVLVCDSASNHWPLKTAKKSLLNCVGYVGPEPFLFDASLLTNLCYGLNREPTEEDLKLCLETAGCQFIYKFPQGLSHRVTDQGQGLSAGQKQRISLARALLRKPKVLVLDEATSNLDATTELKLIETLKSLRGQMTMVIITHRDSFLALTDRVARMSESGLSIDK
jgi:ABC-type bacteriocin/lantibiotic exporter with double-glycine peptidase domain